MSGGGGGAPAVEAAPAPPPTPVVPVTQFDAFTPGQQGLLAAQMQAGYGGILGDYTGGMDHYRDMRTPVFNSPGDVPNYLQNVGLPVVEGGTPANPHSYYQATVPGYVTPAAATAAQAAQAAPALTQPQHVTSSTWQTGSGGGADR